MPASPALYSLAPFRITSYNVCYTKLLRLPFDAFGEAELFSSERYALTIEAMAESACLCLSADALIRAAPRNHRLLAYLCGRLGAKLNRNNFV